MEAEEMDVKKEIFPLKQVFIFHGVDLFLSFFLF